jgi:hypothetical protein
MAYYNLLSLRKLDLIMITTNLYHGVEHGSKAHHNSRQFLLPSGQKIGITGELWIDNTTGFGSVGAINLVMYLESKSLMEAAAILDEFNNSGQSTSSLITQNNCNKIITYNIPNPCVDTWYKVKSYLTNIRKIPEYIVNDLYINKLLWSDDRFNCVFPRDLNSGAYLRGTWPGVPFKRTIGINGRPYVIPGNDTPENNLVIITEAPIDGMSLKFYYPNATVICTGGRMGFDKVLPYLLPNVTKVLLAHDNDKGGNEQAAYFMDNIKLNKERILPDYNKKDWNEALIFYYYYK